MSEIAETDPIETEPEGATPGSDELGENGLKALIVEREARKLAEKASADLALQLKAIEDKDKTEAQRQQDALDTAKRELEQVTAAKTRAEVAADKSIPTALLAGPASNSQEDIGKFADALLAFRGEQGSARLTASREGHSPTKPHSDTREFVAELFGKRD